MTSAESTRTTDLERTYRDHRLGLLRLAFLLCGSRELAEDVVQTAFAAAATRWAAVEDPPAYLRRAVVNLVKDEQRRVIRRRAVPLPEPPSVAHPPEIDETWVALTRLTPVQRSVVVLHYYEDLPLLAVAEVLDRPASTVRSDLRRALDRLRKELS